MNWMTPHDIYLNSAQVALHEAVKASGATSVHVESTTNGIGNEPNIANVTWASVRVINISRRVAVMAHYFTNNKFKIETGWDNAESELIADRMRARLLEIQIGYENERRPDYSILPAPANKVLAPI
jgi:hypothetical protein